MHPRKQKSEDERFMRLAIEKAREGVKKGQTPFGACIVKNGKVVSTGHNEVWARTDITAHAEIIAIGKACRKLKTVHLKDCTLYSTTEPCPMCFSAIHWARIPRTVFGTGIPDAKEFGFNELCISATKMKTEGRLGVTLVPCTMKKENHALFKEWAKRKDAKPY